LFASGGVEKVKEDVKKDKMVRATKKGAAVLDQNIPDHIKVNYHVLQVVCSFILPRVCTFYFPWFIPLFFLRFIQFLR
jgi:hypothetical protein